MVEIEGDYGYLSTEYCMVQRYFFTPYLNDQPEMRSISIYRLNTRSHEPEEKLFMGVI